MSKPRNEAARGQAGIPWPGPLLALAVFIGGILAAVGHHIYYDSLDNTPVYSEDQQV